MLRFSRSGRSNVKLLGWLLDSAPRIVLALGLSALAVVAVMARREALTGERPLAGLRLDDVPEIEWTPQGYTVLLVLSERCTFCTQSAGALRAITQPLTAVTRAIQTVAVTYDPIDQHERYLRRNDITVQRIYSIQRITNLTDVTPRVVVVDGEGVVLRDWTGLVDDARRDEIVGLLTQLRKHF